jgi:hypothetical protein
VSRQREAEAVHEFSVIFGGNEENDDMFGGAAFHGGAWRFHAQTSTSPLGLNRRLVFRHGRHA